MPVRMWLLCLVCVTAPAWGADGKDGGVPEPEVEEHVFLDLQWEVGDDDKTWKEPCAFAPGGELWRLSGSSPAGWSMTAGSEQFALRLEGTTVLSFGQEGVAEFGGGAEVEESERWKVRCQPGRVEIVTPAIPVSMQVGTWELKLDPRFSRLLRPGSRELEDPAVQTLVELFDAVASGMGLDSPNGPWREGIWQVSGLGEALIRARLLNVERLLAASHLDQARQTLNAVPKDPGLAELSSWAADLNRRLEEVHSKPPLMATGVRKVGAIMSLPKALHEEDHPVLFWRRTQLCVKQEQSKPPRMRCVEARTGGWGKEEPYRSPYGRWQVELEYQGARRYNTTRVVSDGPEASPSEDDEWYEPVVVARGKGGRLVVVSQKDPLQHSELENLELATGPGSLLAGGGKYYFSKPDELRSLEVAGLAWKFVVPAPGGEVRCAAPPGCRPMGSGRPARPRQEERRAPRKPKKPRASTSCCFGSPLPLPEALRQPGLNSFNICQSRYSCEYVIDRETGKSHYSCAL